MSGLLLEIERKELIRVLSRRAVKLYMQETLREMHKSSFLLPGEWEEMHRAYVVMFPGVSPPRG